MTTTSMTMTTTWTAIGLMPSELRHAVILSGVEVGVLHQRGDYVRFSFLDDYWDNPERPVLGLWFEDNRNSPVASALRLPPWFANLLPEGRLRTFIARDRGVSPEREMELLAQVGKDLPGAVEIIDGAGANLPWSSAAPTENPAGLFLPGGEIRFSLAGVGLKFSMRKRGERFTLPASGSETGKWIVKLPDPEHVGIPVNEFTMMTLARDSGINVPQVELLHRDAAFGLPDSVWANGEAHALAVRRFDRDDGHHRIHIEDFAQVRGFRDHQKYDGSFETVAALCYRGQDEGSLHEFVRRIVFNIVVGNGDAHLKNWSLIYPDRRIPRLSPAYDLISTMPYADTDDELALKFGRSRRVEDFSPWVLDHLERRLGVPPGSLVAVANQTYARLAAAWDPERLPPELAFVRSWIERSILRSRSLFGF